MNNTLTNNISNQENINSYLNKKIDIEYFEEIDSTNNYAKKVSNNYTKDYLIVAESQTAGRGRIGHSFYSPKNGVYFSLCLKELENINYFELLTIYAGVAVSKALEKLYSLNTKIKWVNDIYFNNKKCGGILTEILFKDEKVNNAIIGIGININTELGSLNNIATSLMLNTPNKNQLVAEIINQIYTLFSLPKEDVIEMYNNILLLKDKEIKFEFENKTMVGLVSHINENGHLIVNVNNKLIELSSGEVSLHSSYISELLKKN